MHLLKFGLQAVHLGTGTGGRVEIADLLESQHQLEDMLNGCLLSHVRQPQHPLFFCPPIGFALIRRQGDVLVAVKAGRHVFEHFVLGPPQDVVSSGCPQGPGRHPLVDMARGHEFEDAYQILRAVLNRRAGERPGTLSRQRADRFAGLARAVLDPLGLIKHDQIELKAEFRHDIAVSHHRLVVGHLHRHIGKRPLPAAAFRVTLDDADHEFWRPNGQFPGPVRDQALRADHQHPPGLAGPNQEPKR